MERGRVAHPARREKGDACLRAAIRDRFTPAAKSSRSSRMYRIAYNADGMIRTRDITTVSDFRSRLRDHIDDRKKSNRPLFVTNNGATEAVVLSPEAFDKLADQAELLASLKLLDRSEEDVKKGKTVPAKKGLRRIADKLKLPMKR
jgi:PHD/YefM family antitoxin component YafN of YafNO toxin-antitoxin module